jgi:hypothetical protein
MKKTLAIKTLIFLEKVMFKFKLGDYGGVSRLLGYFVMKERIEIYRKQL